MDPYTQFLNAIKDELTNDPQKLGYAGKTPAEQATLLNTPYTIMVPQIQTPRIAQIINQIPFAPNLATAIDVTNSKNPITPTVVIATAQEVTSKV